jgi:hypothetical protein
MISRPEWYAFLILLLFACIRFDEKLSAIRKELKELREKIGVK